MLPNCPWLLLPLFFRSAFNAWNTSSRYGGVVKNCPFCNAEEADVLEHFACCEAVRDICRKLFPSKAHLFDIADWANFLLIKGSPSSLDIYIVFLVHDGLHQAHVDQRHGCSTCMDALVQSRMRSMGCRFAVVRRVRVDAGFCNTVQGV